MRTSDVEFRGMSAISMEEAFLAALDEEARPRFAGVVTLAATLDNLRCVATATYRDLTVDAAMFAGEIARRLGPAANPEQLAHVRADHVQLAIACAAADQTAIRRFESDFLDEVDATARRLRARPDQADEVRSHVRRILFISEPGRPAALREYSGRGDLRSYLRVIVTRELVRLINKDQHEVCIDDHAFLDMLSPASDPQLGYLRERYSADVDAAVRAAITTLRDEPRALLRYSIVYGWSIDRIGALYGIHRTTAGRRVAAAREELGMTIRAELAARLAIPIDQVDSIVRLVQSRINLSLERLLE